MELHVLFDRSGKILAAVELKKDAETPPPRPVAGRGQRTADVTVPEEHRHLSFLEVCTQLAVKVDGAATVLVPTKHRSAGSPKKDEST